MIITPKISEKAYGLSMGQVYVFNVPTNASKIAIKAQVEADYNVKVKSVRTLTTKGKVKNVNTRTKRTIGRRVDVKKAFVTMQEGSTIAIFDEMVKEAES